MRASQLFIHTSREAPSEAELVSHRLMLRAGFLRQLASGIFSWLPLGWRVVRKIENLVREEMDRAGAAEIMMPAVQPAELWQESGRWKHYGADLLRLQDRHRRNYCIGPTHEEVATDIVRTYARSWRHLPVNLYQIQTKFRDEIRPRFGVMRAREFVMKDAYSFDIDEEGARRSYRLMRDAYVRIFDRIGLDYRIVSADSGAIGGSMSEEFLVLAESGEAVIAHTSGGYAANLDRVPCPPSALARPQPGAEMEKFPTPGIRTIADLAQFMDSPPPAERSVKTMIATGDAGMAALLLRGDHTLNIAKATALAAVGFGARLAEPEEAAARISADFGSLGPVGMPLPVIADHGLAATHNFVCGANENDMHLRNVNFGRDCPEPLFADLRMATEGDSAPDGLPLRLRRGIEVGHVFNLGDKYSAAMGAKIEDENNCLRTVKMGCYGIGVTRIVAAAIEQGHDEKGIIFPVQIAPFAVAVLPLGGKQEVRRRAEQLHAELLQLGVEALLDDRGLRPGAAFADLDLVGIPHRLVVSERGLQEGRVEHKRRTEDSTRMFAADGAAAHVRDILARDSNNGPGQGR